MMEARNITNAQLNTVIRRIRTDTGKYSFVNRTIQHWNQLPAEVLGNLPCKPIAFKEGKESGN